jgi:hypothetical protein
MDQRRKLSGSKSSGSAGVLGEFPSEDFPVSPGLSPPPEAVVLGDFVLGDLDAGALETALVFDVAE